MAYSPTHVDAVHEAGHAVADWVLDLPFAYVTIRSRAIVRFGAARYTHAGPHLQLRYAVAHLAGPCAVELLTGTTDNGAAADYRHATAALAAVTHSTPSDRDLRQAYHAAALLLQRYKAALVALAEKLDYEQTLSYSAVAAVCAASVVRQ